MKLNIGRIYFIGWSLLFLAIYFISLLATVLISLILLTGMGGILNMAFDYRAEKVYKKYNIDTIK